MKIILLAALFTSHLACADQPTPPAAATAEGKSVDDILSRSYREKSKAIEAYLAANPKAPDSAQALLDLIQLYEETDDKAYAAGLLSIKEKFDAQIAASPEVGIALLDSLASHYEKTGDKVSQLSALEKQYTLIAKGADVDWRTASDNVIKRFYLVWRGAQSTPEEVNKIEALFDQAGKDFPQSKDDRRLAYQEAKLKWPRAGDTLELAFTALDGSRIDVAGMKGKVVCLIYWPDSSDFSTTELPAIKAVYDQYHAKGLEIIGISLEESKAVIENLIKNEGIPWVHAFDGKGWNSPHLTQTRVTAAPFNLVIGKDGKVADICHSDQLGAKVAALLR